MPSESVTRWWRQVHPGANPLVRRWDRAENRLLLVVVVVALVAVPVLAAIGSTVYAQHAKTMGVQQANRAQAVAVLLEDVPISTRTGRGIPGTTEVTASWTSPDGIIREGEVPAQFGATKGTEVQIWIDANGELTTRPQTRVDAALLGFGAAVAGWLIFVSILTVVCLGVHALANRARYAEWDREWLHISRDSIGP